MMLLRIFAKVETGAEASAKEMKLSKKWQPKNKNSLNK